jgi:hypothetical protein
MSYCKCEDAFAIALWFLYLFLKSWFGNYIRKAAFDL